MRRTYAAYATPTTAAAPRWTKGLPVVNPTLFEETDRGGDAGRNPKANRKRTPDVEVFANKDVEKHKV
jgi:hypothetical protein